MRSLARVAVAAAVALAGCEKSSAPPPPPPPAVTDLTAVLEGIVVHLRWTPPAGEYDGFKIQYREAGAEQWQQLPGTAPAGTYGVDLELGTGAPEHARVEFRLATARGAARTPGNVVGIVTPINPALQVTALLPQDPLAGPAAGPVTVTWFRGSMVATAIRLERQVVGPDGAVSAWVELPVALGATSYVDEATEEVSVHRYRIRYGVDGEWSAAAEGASARTGLRPPTGVTARVEGDGVRVSWDAKPGAELWVASCGGGACYPFPGTSAGESTGRFLPGLPWPDLAYRVVAQRTVDWITYSASSAPVPLEPYAIASGTLRLEPAPIALPASDGGVRAGTGAVHLVGADGVLLAGTGAGWDTLDLAGRWSVAPPGLLVDVQDHPHAVIYPASYDVVPPSSLVHAWHDGTRWNTETIGTVVPPAAAYPEVVAAIAGGAVHVAYVGSSDPSAPALHAFQADGAWRTEPIPVAGLTELTDLSVADDGAVALLSEQKMVLALRDPASGAWTTSVLPDSVPPFAALAGAAPAVARAWTPAFPDQDLEVVTWLGDRWDAPERISREARLDVGPWSKFSWRRSPDGARMHLVLERADGLVLFDRTADGWRRIPLLGSAPAWFSSGYAGGKLWVMASRNSLRPGAAVFMEP